MKPNTYIIAFILVVFSLPQTLIAQTSQEQLIGTWTLNYEASKLKMETKAKEFHDRMDTARKDRLEKAYKGRKLSFGADGSFLQQLADGREVSGTWALNTNEKTMTITYTNEKLQFYKIKSLTSTALVLKQENSGNTKMVLSEWHFTKN